MLKKGLEQCYCHNLQTGVTITSDNYGKLQEYMGSSMRSAAGYAPENKENLVRKDIVQR